MSAQNPILTIDSDGDFSIGGDVVGRDKVTAIASIGTVNGNVFVVNEKTIHNVLPKLCSSDQLQDVSKYLNLVVTSQRFGTKFQL